MNPKQKVMFATILFIIGAASLVGLSYYAEQKQTLDLETFTIDVPAGSTFNITEPELGDSIEDFATVYSNDDLKLVITHIDKKYIEDSFENRTNMTIDFAQISEDYIQALGAQKINETSGNISYYRISFAGASETAGMYKDDNHLILVEGKDSSLITEITPTIKIK